MLAEVSLILNFDRLSICECFNDEQSIFTVSKLPSIETIENCMKLSPMIIQGLWEYKSTFLQLPFVTDDHLRMFATKKRHIKNLQQFAQLKPDESRHILKHLSDFEYEQVMRVLGRMPSIDFSIRCEGKANI